MSTRDYSVNRQQKPKGPHGFLRRRSAIIASVAIALFTLTGAVLLLRPFGPVRGNPALDEAATLFPYSIQEYSLKFPKQFDRLAYPYSVVSGGVANASEARRAVLTDSVVRAHYRHLNLDTLRSTVLAEGRTAYVSYRKGEKVFWTSKKVHLFKGEAVLTDGANLIRARCGNLVSDTLPAGSSTEAPPLHAPPDAVLNTPTMSNGMGTVTPPGGLATPSAPVTNPAGPAEPAVTPGLVLAASSRTPGDFYMPSFGFPGMSPGGTAEVGGNGGTPIIIPPPTGTTTPPGGDGTTTGGGATPITQPPVVNPPTQPPSGPEPPAVPPVTPPRTFPGALSPVSPFRGPSVIGRPIAGDTPEQNPPEPVLTDPLPNPGSGPVPDPFPVPEPTSWLLIATGTIGLLCAAALNRRRILAAIAKPE